MSKANNSISFRFGYLLGLLIILIISLGLLGILGWIAYKGLTELKFEQSVLWTAFLGGIAWLIKSVYEKKLERDRWLISHKQQQYLEFLDFLNSCIAYSKKNAEPVFDVDKLRLWSLRLGLFASDSVLKAWNQVRLQDYEGADHTQLLAPWAHLLLEIRKDSGHFDTRATPSELLKLFVNDVDSYATSINRKVK